MNRAWAFVISVTVATTLCPIAGAADVYALKGAAVYPVTGPAIPNATLVIRDGVIESVGPSTTVEIPYDATLIDAQGL